jgi:hypothetical protein
MNRVIEIDHRIWEGSSPSELGYGGLENQTFVQTFTHEDGSTHDVLVIDGRESNNGRTILKSASLNYRIDPLRIRQESIAASKLKARIALAELPGVSGLPINREGVIDTSIDVSKKIETVRQTRKEFFEVAQGKFDLLARKQLIALARILKLSEHETVELHGHSLAAMIAATMGRVTVSERAPIPLRIARIHMEDPVNIFDTSPLKFAQILNDMKAETHRRDTTYLQENVDIGHGDIVPIEQQSNYAKAINRYVKSKQRPVVINSLQAIRKGIAPIIQEVIDSGLQTGVVDSDTTISTTHFRDSLVSEGSQIQEFNDMLSSSGVQSEAYEYIPALDDPTELGHLTDVSLGRAASIAAFTY